MENTIFTQKSTCSAIGTTFSKYQASKVEHSTTHLQFNSRIKYRHCFSVPQQNLGLRFQNGTTTNKNMTVYSSTQPGAPVPGDPSPAGHWKLWVIGTIFTIVLSFGKGKWGPLLLLRDKIETTIEKVEQVADMVEEVAEKVDKVAEEVVKNIPEGKLHDVAELVEKVAEDIDKNAQNAEDALEKVEDMEKDLESFVKSTILEGKGAVITKGSKDQKQ